MQDYEKYIVKKGFDIIHHGGYTTFRKDMIINVLPSFISSEYFNIIRAEGEINNVHYDQLHQILPYLEKIPSGKSSQGLVGSGEDDHAGQIYNPITGEWSWL